MIDSYCNSRSFKFLGIVLFLFHLSSCKDNVFAEKWGNWYRPADQPVFAINHGNNHDAILFVDTSKEYPYYMIVSGSGCENDSAGKLEETFLWRSKTFSWSSDKWELVSENYKIGCQYEYDDGLNVNGKYYVYENGVVYTYEGALEDANGRWKQEGSFPVELCDDIAVYYEDGVFHLFGEYGYFPHGPDGSSLSHLTSTTGTGDWTMVDTAAINPNIDGGNAYGVGDPTIIKMGGEYYLYCDIESEDVPYKIIAWKSENINSRFQKLGITIEARSGETDDWDNQRVQDGDIAWIPELSKYVMVVNMRDTDGNPGGHFPTLDGFTRVVGFFYADHVENGK